MARIFVESVAFSEKHPFRKFRGLELPFAKGITLICGHNGIGKSTILGLLASCSGVSARAKRTYLGKPFNANIGEIIYIDFATEVEPKLAANTFVEPVLTYSVGGQPFQKKCSLTKKKTAKRARSVPRSVPYEAARIGDIPISKDQKVPLPTLYLGMIRMLPLGEVLESRLSTEAADTDWDDEDKEFVQRFMSKIMRSAGRATPGGRLEINHVLQTKKFSAHPAYTYNSRSVSIGQDSLGSIAAGLASFERLKREMGDDYPGGLLIIDELDAGFHPHAIKLLVQELRKLSRELELQIIATTHSTRLIEAVHPDGPIKAPGSQDRVIYLQDTQRPTFDPAFDLASILSDMDVAPVEVLPIAKVRLYFEDAEGVQVFRAVTSKALIERLEQKHGIELVPVELNVGCDSLLKMPGRDPHFKTVVLVADGDASGGKLPSNFVTLPSDGVVEGKGRGPSPERTLLRFIHRLYEEDYADNAAVWSHLRGLDVRTRDRLLFFISDPSIAPSSDRHVLKKWWREHSNEIRKWKLYEHWAAANAPLLEEYEARLEAAVDAAMKAQRAAAMKIKRGEALD